MTTLFLCYIAWQDFKDRLISVYPLGALVLLFIMAGAYEIGWLELVRSTAINLAFLVFQFMCLVVWFSLKNGRLTNIFDQLIGWGDVAFFGVICFAFSPVNFLFVYVSGLIVVAIGFTIYKKMNPETEKTIPLAGGFALYVLFLRELTSYLPEWGFREDGVLVSLISFFN